MGESTISMNPEESMAMETTEGELQPPALSEEDCKVCNTLCSPCQGCSDSQDGECYKCWHCFNWDDDEFEKDHEECRALSKDHDWEDQEVRCLHNPKGPGDRDCRACWVGSGDV